MDEDENLIIAEYRQAPTRYAGTEAQVDIGLHPNIWLNLGADYVNAGLVSTGTPLPRIPPLRGKVGLELRYKGLLLNPEVVMAQDQTRLFPNETRTAGYTVFGVSGSYLIARQHAAHIISFNAFNLGDRLYRNHLSFIKEFRSRDGSGVAGYLYPAILLAGSFYLVHPREFFDVAQHGVTTVKYEELPFPPVRNQSQRAGSENENQDCSVESAGRFVDSGS